MISSDQSPYYNPLTVLPGGLGLLLTIEMCRLWPDLSPLYGSRQLLSSELLMIQQRPYFFSIHSLGWSISLSITEIVVYILALLYISCGLLLFLGRTTLAITLTLFFLHYVFFISNYTWSYGADYLAQTGLFFSLLFGLGTPKDINRKTWMLIGHHLFRLQLSFVYFFAGLGKAMGTAWWNGEAIWKAVQQPFAPPLIAIPIAVQHLAPLWMLLGILTVIFEISYPLVWIRGVVRPTIITGIVLMHVGIGLCMGLTHFSCLMIWYNLCAWSGPLLQYIAKPIIKPLEPFKSLLQVWRTTNLLDTRKGGDEQQYH
ncbi:hypothetical protein ACK8HY_13980 [Sphingobacterium sp. NGMCC 1.201703]|uniref:hypothetical protein n=1 Tax=Sphingobacterium sp. NGMCC 1.201703 TaxID=3388657 RepID=UPI0039FC2284